MILAATAFFWSVLSWAAPVTWTFSGTATTGDGIYSATPGTAICASMISDDTWVDRVGDTGDPKRDRFNEGNNPGKPHLIITVTAGGFTRSTATNVGAGSSDWDLVLEDGFLGQADVLQAQVARAGGIDDFATIGLVDGTPVPPSEADMWPGTDNLTDNMGTNPVPTSVLVSSANNSQYLAHSDVDGSREGLLTYSLATAALSICGDGQVSCDEGCDDGNVQSGDGCRLDCTEEICGDGIPDPQEECDDGNLIDGDGCQANCALPVCGDGVLDSILGEECDDGNSIGGDGCSETCHVEVCGNEIVDPGEDCDDGNANIGDGCRPDCSQELCGDGVLDPQEECDDANNVPGDGCRADCSEEICGDGLRDPQEQCDDGNNIDGDGCQMDCVLPVCGDGIVDPGEQCDDGNANVGDGCSATCQVEVCGNGILDPGEVCDDENLNPGDGCRGDCTLEICGDGVLDPQEQCDDGNNIDGDGCSSDCEIEALGGGQGCTPGYWKQEQHADSWPAAYTAGTIAEGGTAFDDVFENAFPNQSLSQVLRMKGGGLSALGRHAVAALLNGASSEVSYDHTASEVIQMFDQTHPGSKGAYDTLKNNFESLNEQGCPLN